MRRCLYRSIYNTYNTLPQNFNFWRLVFWLWPSLYERPRAWLWPVAKNHSICYVENNLGNFSYIRVLLFYILLFHITLLYNVTFFGVLTVTLTVANVTRIPAVFNIIVLHIDIVCLYYQNQIFLQYRHMYVEVYLIFPFRYPQKEISVPMRLFSARGTPNNKILVESQVACLALLHCL